jgi:hypothetical protein
MKFSNEIIKTMEKEFFYSKYYRIREELALNTESSDLINLLYLDKNKKVQDNLLKNINTTDEIFNKILLQRINKTINYNREFNYRYYFLDKRTTEDTIMKFFEFYGRKRQKEDDGFFQSQFNIYKYMAQIIGSGILSENYFFKIKEIVLNKPFFEENKEILYASVFYNEEEIINEIQSSNDSKIKSYYAFNPNVDLVKLNITNVSMHNEKFIALGITSNNKNKEFLESVINDQNISYYYVYHILNNKNLSFTDKLNLLKINNYLFTQLFLENKLNIESLLKYKNENKDEFNSVYMAIIKDTIYASNFVKKDYINLGFKLKDIKPELSQINKYNINTFWQKNLLDKDDLNELLKHKSKPVKEKAMFLLQSFD